MTGSETTIKRRRRSFSPSLGRSRRAPVRRAKPRVRGDRAQLDHVGAGRRCGRVAPSVGARELDAAKPTTVTTRQSRQSTL
jgi:hypothetical protein